MKKLKEKLSAKLSKNGGFTLIEMLIVVAIIAILMMVSIPIVSNTLEKAREGVDDANLRSAVSVMSIEYLAESEADKAAMVGTVYYYHVDEEDKAGGSHQGSVSTIKDGAVKAKSKLHGSANNEILQVTVDADGKATADFVEP